MQQTADVLQNQPKSKLKSIALTVLLCLGVTLVIFGLFFGMLRYFKVFPFSKSCVSQYDLAVQIVPFAEHFFDVVKGDASLFYSYRLAGGMDVFGTVMYCLFSPFTFIFFLFGETNVYYAASFMLPVKLSCIAISAIILMRVRFQKMHPLLVLPTALLYAFCGYTFVSNTYINWMDFLIYLPLGVLAFDFMRKTGKIRYLALVITACIYTCFSIACFSMFISYPIFVLYGFLVLKKQERKDYLFKISLAYLCGVLAALPIMLPSLFAYLQSGRNTGLFDSLWKDVSSLSYYRKFSYILSDALFILLIVVYFIQNRFKTKESRFLFFAGILIMMPVLVDECCLLLNMGSYMSYALRFGFLNAVYELFVACLVLEQFSFSRKTRFVLQLESAMNAENSAPMPVNTAQNRVKVKPASPQSSKELKDKKRKNAVWHTVIFIIFALLSVLACLAIYEIFCVVRNKAGINFSFWPALESLIKKAKELSVDFSSSFAHSTGGLEGIAILFGVVGIIVVLGALLYKFRLLNVKLLYPCMAAVLLSQVVFYSSQIVSGNIYNPIRYDICNRLFEQMRAQDDDPDYYYRIKDYSDSMSCNYTVVTDVNAYSVFSSVTDSDNFAAAKVLGTGGNGVNTIKNFNGTLLADCFLSHRYFLQKLDKDGNKSTPLNRDYLEEISSERDFVLFKNSLAFPTAYTLSNSDMGVTEEYNDYFNNMQNLYTFLGGEGEVFTTYPLTSSDVGYTTVTNEKTKESEQVIYVRLYLKTSGDFSLYSELPTDKGIKYFVKPDEFTKAKDISEIKTFTYQNKSSFSFYTVYLYSDDPTYELTVEEVKEKCFNKAISKATVEQLSAELWQRACEYEIKNTFLQTSYNVSATAQTDGEYLFMNYVAIDGMKAYVNGKEVELIENGMHMILVPLGKGVNQVEIRYSSPYPVYSILSIIVSILSFSFIAYVLNKKQDWVKNLQTPVAVASVALSLAVFAVFMVFPTAVFIRKLLLL